MQDCWDKDDVIDLMTDTDKDAAAAISKVGISWNFRRTERDCFGCG